MPKQRQTCTRCSQRRQKCDRKEPCTRCVQNGEAKLCTTVWIDGPVRKYPRKPSSWRSGASSSETATSSLDASPADPIPNNGPAQAGQDVSARPQTPVAAQDQLSTTPVWPSKLPELTISSLLSEKDKSTQQSLPNQNMPQTQTKDLFRFGPTSTNLLSPTASAIQLQHIQSLLPAKAKLIPIVEYYEQCR